MLGQRQPPVLHFVRPPRKLQSASTLTWEPSSTEPTPPGRAVAARTDLAAAVCRALERVVRLVLPTLVRLGRQALGVLNRLPRVRGRGNPQW